MEKSDYIKGCKTVLVTGAAGFIGYHLCESLLKLGHIVVGLDKINDYYDVNLKYARLQQLGIERRDAEVYLNTSISSIYGDRLLFVRMNLSDSDSLPELFNSHSFDVVCNLAAQVGVRYSLKNPKAYIDSNINGFINLLECCRKFDIGRLIYASSSSTYGNSSEVPFTEDANVDHPISIYAATKKSNELMAHTYSHLYNIETIGLRFFTVYGPWGRPDMAMFLFTEAILKGKPIDVFNHGDLSRDFTYVSDIVEGIVNTVVKDSENKRLYKLYNIGKGTPIQLMDFITAIENKLGLQAEKNMMPMQSGDVNETWASTSALENDYDYHASINVQQGISSFIDWYLLYYKK